MTHTGLFGTPYSCPGGVQLGTPLPIAEVTLSGALGGRGTLAMLEVAQLLPAALMLTGQLGTPFSLLGAAHPGTPLPLEVAVSLGAGQLHGQGVLEPAYAEVLDIALQGQACGQGSSEAQFNTLFGSVVGRGSTEALLTVTAGGLAGETYGQGTLEPAYAEHLDVSLAVRADLHGQGSTAAVSMAGPTLAGSVVGQGTTATSAPPDVAFTTIPTLEGQGRAAVVLAVEIDLGQVQTGGQGQISIEQRLEPAAEGLRGRGSMDASLGVVRLPSTRYGVRTYAPVPVGLPLRPSLARYARAVVVYAPGRYLEDGAWPILPEVGRATMAHDPGWRRRQAKASEQAWPPPWAVIDP